MNVSFKNPLNIHFPISLNTIQRFLHPSSKSRTADQSSQKNEGFLDGEIRFFEDNEEVEDYVKSFRKY